MHLRFWQAGGDASPSGRGAGLGALVKFGNGAQARSHRARPGAASPTAGPQPDEAEPLPATVGATAVLARTRDGPRVVVTGAIGPSGARLLGRFCHSDPHVDQQFPRANAFLRQRHARMYPRRPSLVGPLGLADR